MYLIEDDQGRSQDSHDSFLHLKKYIKELHPRLLVDYTYLYSIEFLDHLILLLLLLCDVLGTATFRNEWADKNQTEESWCTGSVGRKDQIGLAFNQKLNSLKLYM